MATVTPEMREVFLAAPEQFCAVEALLKAAAEATHVSERAEMWEVPSEVAEGLTAAAKASRETAAALAGSLCSSSEVAESVVTFLTEQAAV